MVPIVNVGTFGMFFKATPIGFHENPRRFKKADFGVWGEIWRLFWSLNFVSCAFEEDVVSRGAICFVYGHMLPQGVCGGLLDLGTCPLFFGEGLKGNKTGAVGRVMCSRDNRGGFTRAALSSFTRASAAFLSFALG